MFKDLLVVTTGKGDDAAALGQACAMAEANDGHVAVLVQTSLPIVDGQASGVFSPEAIVQLHESVHREAVAQCDRWRESLRRSGVMGEVRLLEDLLAHPPTVAAVHARYADLAFVGLGPPGSKPSAVDEHVASLLMGSGRPVMVVPAGSKAMTCSRIVVGWQPSANAARAVHDAMPFFDKAEAIHVVCVDPRRGGGGHGADPGADIARHLARHGYAVTVQVEHAMGDDPGRVLMRHAQEFGAHLLVAGGFSHSRFRERLLGGTTTYLLQNAAVPILLSH